MKKTLEEKLKSIDKEVYNIILMNGMVSGIQNLLDAMNSAYQQKDSPKVVPVSGIIELLCSIQEKQVEILKGMVEKQNV